MTFGRKRGIFIIPDHDEPRDFYLLFILRASDIFAARYCCLCHPFSKSDLLFIHRIHFPRKLTLPFGVWQPGLLLCYSKTSNRFQHISATKTDERNVHGTYPDHQYSMNVVDIYGVWHLEWTILSIKRTITRYSTALERDLFEAG